MRIPAAIRPILFLLAVAALAAAPALAAKPEVFVVDDPGLIQWPPPTDLDDRMHVVFEDQIHWTRMMALGILDDLQGKEAFEARLKGSYDACADVLRPYYGDDAEKFRELIETHVALTIKVFEQLKRGNFASELPAWYDNGDALAKLMGDLNPKFWPEAESRLYWRMYLDGTLDAALARRRGDWASDVAADDALHRHVMRMADFMTTGIESQFPIK
jgi:hypothetical protein